MTPNGNTLQRVLAGLGAFVLLNLSMAYVQADISASRNPFWENFRTDLVATGVVIVIVVLLLKALGGQWPWERDF